jgi:hypothetical protein
MTGSGWFAGVDMSDAVVVKDKMWVEGSPIGACSQNLTYTTTLGDEEREVSRCDNNDDVDLCVILT